MRTRTLLGGCLAAALSCGVERAAPPEDVLASASQPVTGTKWCSTNSGIELPEFPVTNYQRPPADSRLEQKQLSMVTGRQQPVLLFRAPRASTTRVVQLATRDAAGIRTVQSVVRDGRTLKVARVQRVSDDGVVLAESPAPTGNALTTVLSTAAALDGLSFPPDMPAIEFPDIQCSGDEKVKIQRAWALAHHHVWRMRQLIEFIAAGGNLRDDYWTDGYVDNDTNWSVRNWLGRWDSERFDTVREAVGGLYAHVRHAEVEGGAALHIMCDSAWNAQADGPVGYHATIGFINVTHKGLWEDLGGTADVMDFRDDHNRARLLLHELMHHQNVHYEDALGSHISHPLGDTHFHRHNHPACNTNNDTDYMIDHAEAKHLAHYDHCKHERRATFNNENYALAIHFLGRAVFTGALPAFPTTVHTQVGGSPPGPDACDPTSGEAGDHDCVKIGQEWVCPPSAGGGVVIPETCLAPLGLPEL